MSNRSSLATNWRSPGFWMAVLLVIFQCINAARAWLDPAGFSNYFGVPAQADEFAWVAVYGTRTAFIAVFASVLLLTNQLRALSLMALVATILPLGDLAVAFEAGAPNGTLARHAALVPFLALAAFYIHRWSIAARSAEDAP